MLEVSGFCPICEENTIFKAEKSGLRDHFLCERCRSVPRERALVHALNLFFPGWRQMRVHESSPSPRAITQKFQKECKEYVASQFWQDIPSGEYRDGMRCENIEKLTFPHNSFELHITQDVFEHIMDPEAALKEIKRTLVPGGGFVFTAPLVRKNLPTRRRASLSGDGNIEYIEEPSYHGNPISSEGSLVTMDWGYDITTYIRKITGMEVLRLDFNDPRMGLVAEYLDVIVCVRH